MLRQMKKLTKTERHLLAHKVAVFIEDHLSEILNMHRLARSFQISRTTLLGAFELAYGCSPAKYIRNARIEKAKNLLLRTDLAVREISYQVGYPNHANFTTTFGKIVGMAPQQFRNSERMTSASASSEIGSCLAPQDAIPDFEKRRNKGNR
jgi:AraC family transcriptional regulator